MDINLTDTQFFIGLLVIVIILFSGIYAYLLSKLKGTSGVIPLEKVDIKVYNDRQNIELFINDKLYKKLGCPVAQIIKINTIEYLFFYYQGDDFCSLYRTNSKGIYECKRINVNFK